jgi:hypothetical protein
LNENHQPRPPDTAKRAKQKLADRAEGVATALRHLSENLRSDQKEHLARYTAVIADKLGQLTSLLKDHDDRSAAKAQTAFDRSRPSGPPTQAGIGDARDDATLRDEVTAPAGFGPAPGGYGPASAPAGAHGGSGIFGAEGAGGGPGNEPLSPPDEETRDQRD